MVSRICSSCLMLPLWFQCFVFLLIRICSTRFSMTCSLKSEFLLKQHWPEYNLFMLINLRVYYLGFTASLFEIVICNVIINMFNCITKKPELMVKILEMGCWVITGYILFYSSSLSRVLSTNKLLHLMNWNGRMEIDSLF